jgi:CBS-domain-containing membrane protein
MKEKDIGPIPVVDDRNGKFLVGIVTDRDLALNIVANDEQPSKITVSQIMSENVVCCQPEDDIEDALELMQTHQVRRIPVIDSEGRLLGIISQGDVANRLNWSDKTARIVEEISKQNHNGRGC